MGGPQIPAPRNQGQRHLGASIWTCCIRFHVRCCLAPSLQCHLKSVHNHMQTSRRHALIIAAFLTRQAVCWRKARGKRRPGQTGRKLGPERTTSTGFLPS